MPMKRHAFFTEDGTEIAVLPAIFDICVFVWSVLSA
jgi:hypothetical protein